MAFLSDWSKRYRDIAISCYCGWVTGQRAPSKTKVPIEFGAELYEWLRGQAFIERRPMAELVREAVGQYKYREESQLRLPLGRGN